MRNILGTKTLQNTLGLITQTHQVADQIAVDMESQINQLQKAFLKVKDTRSDIKNANQFIQYFGKELFKDKIWRGLLIFIIILIIVVVCLRNINPSKRDIVPYDVLNGYD